MITIRALSAGALAIATMLSLQGCIGVGDSWQHDPSTAQPVPPTVAIPPSPRPTTTAAPTPAASTSPTPSAALGPIIGTVVVSPGEFNDPRCAGGLPLPTAFTVSTKVTNRDGSNATVKVVAQYVLFGGTGYEGEAQLRFDPASGLYRATLPKLESRHFRGNPRYLQVSVMVREAATVLPAMAVANMTICLGVIENGGPASPSPSRLG
ncbi:hypothetical protein ACFQY4_38165 [Catellatospora bangladeshensis]|uniref:DUF4352 domain-containing protein n=1 Tax=Catellatospora bangladeshensis TaxID=310355 RepID=A0A8J3JP14_9ACTN|nr:hypothetical protein [Catellatospora bangladeshensis]GIF84098.1 hypothetical protein Cba03nite_54470 [Catellatospora bangladeshensis]